MTAVGPKATIAGYLFPGTWIADVYDDPIQFAFANLNSAIRM